MPTSASSGSGTPEASAMSVASSTSRARARRPARSSAIVNEPLVAQARATYRSIGSFSRSQRSISPAGTYDWLSCSACPLRRYVISSTSDVPSPRARAIDGALRRLVRRDHVVAVGLLAGNAVADRLVDELLRGGLLRRRRRVGVAVVLDDHDERTALHRGEVDPFVEGARSTSRRRRRTRGRRDPRRAS